MLLLFVNANCLIIGLTYYFLSTCCYWSELSVIEGSVPNALCSIYLGACASKSSQREEEEGGKKGKKRERRGCIGNYWPTEVDHELQFA